MKKKNKIKLTESQFRNVIGNMVKKLIREMAEHNSHDLYMTFNADWDYILHSGNDRIARLNSRNINSSLFTNNPNNDSRKNLRDMVDTIVNVTNSQTPTKILNNGSKVYKLPIYGRHGKDNQLDTNYLYIEDNDNPEYQNVAFFKTEAEMNL